MYKTTVAHCRLPSSRLSRRHRQTPRIRLNHPLLILCALSVTALLTLGNIAVAAGPNIASVAFEGTNAALTVTISGSGFGSAPPGVPCHSCSTPFIQMGGLIGCFDSYNIVSWTQTHIVLSGLQANPNIGISVVVTNPQTKQVAAAHAATPNTIALTPLTIGPVTFAGSGKVLRITITGSGFGTVPPGAIGDVNTSFFSFIDQPFSSAQWQAGYSGCGDTDAVTLDYASWSDTMIIIGGFGPKYGRGPGAQHKWTVASGDLVTIAVANSATDGLKMGYSSNPTPFGSPLGTGELSIAQLP
jgi:hypothetical protein